MAMWTPNQTTWSLANFARQPNSPGARPFGAGAPGRSFAPQVRSFSWGAATRGFAPGEPNPNAPSFPTGGGQQKWPAPGSTGPISPYPSPLPPRWPDYPAPDTGGRAKSPSGQVFPPIEVGPGGPAPLPAPWPDYPGNPGPMNPQFPGGGHPQFPAGNIDANPSFLRTPFYRDANPPAPSYRPAYNSAGGGPGDANFAPGEPYPGAPNFPGRGSKDSEETPISIPGQAGPISPYPSPMPPRWPDYPSPDSGYRPVYNTPGGGPGDANSAGSGLPLTYGEAQPRFDTFGNYTSAPGGGLPRRGPQTLAGFAGGGYGAGY